MRWELKLLLNGEASRWIPVIGTPFIIGRHSSCQFRLEDLSVSRRHCTLILEGDCLRIEDNQSRNGTLVNCQEINAVTELQPSDVIRIGPYLILVGHVSDVTQEDAIHVDASDCHPMSTSGASASENEKTHTRIADQISNELGRPDQPLTVKNATREARKSPFALVEGMV